MAGRKESELFVSAITMAELHRGRGQELPGSRRRSSLSAWLEQLEAGLEERMLPFTCDTAHVWVGMCAQAESESKPMAGFGSLIAATALAHGLCLVTRNVRDFAQVPVEVLNPWPGQLAWRLFLIASHAA
jgi:predicted nucleic acid-binding protein